MWRGPPLSHIRGTKPDTRKGASQPLRAFHLNPIFFRVESPATFLRVATHRLDATSHLLVKAFPVEEADPIGEPFSSPGAESVPMAADPPWAGRLLTRRRGYQSPRHPVAAICKNAPRPGQPLRTQSHWPWP